MMAKPVNAKAVIATAGTAAADRAKGASIAYGGAVFVGTAGIVTTIAPSRPIADAIIGLIAIAGVLWNAFQASTSGAHAAVLAYASAAL